MIDGVDGILGDTRLFRSPEGGLFVGLGPIYMCVVLSVEEFPQ